MLVQEF